MSHGLRHRLHRYAAALAPKAAAKSEARRAFRTPATTPILVYQMGKVGSTTVVASLEKAGLSDPVLHLHSISDDVRKYREAHVAAGAGAPYHLDLGEAVAAELAASKGKRCKVVSLVRDPIAVEVSGLFEVPQFAPPEVRDASGGIDPAKAAESLRTALAAPHALDYVFDWFDREMLRVFAIDVFAEPFPKEKGAAVFRSERADLLLLRLEDLDRIGSAALTDFLGLPSALELVAANVRSETAQARAYRTLVARLELDREACERIYAGRFARHFYSDDEIRRFIAKWSRKAGA